MNSQTEQTLLSHLQTLYTEPVAQSVMQRLKQLHPGPVQYQPRNDCMLISYANSVVEDAEVPMQTLSRFLARHTDDACGRLHILPFFPSSSDDGFAVIDYRMVDHHVGGWEDVDQLAEQYDLMFDLVINHCSRENLWFADFINNKDPGRAYFITLPEESDTSEVARPRSTPLISSVHTYSGIRHVWNTFSDDQIDLDFANPDVLCEFVDILMFYVRRGARLIRLDAIGYLWKRLGTSCLNLPEVHTVVKILRALMDEVHPDIQIVTETNVPHEENIAYFGAGDEAHMVYQFSLAPLMLYAFVFGDGSYLTSWAQRLSTPPPNTTYLNFIASHDGIGLRPVEGLIPESGVNRLIDTMHERGGFVTMREVSGVGQKPYEINVSLMSAFGGETGLPAFIAAHALLLSFQGSPALYIHSLLGTLNDLELVEQTGRTRSINRKQWALEELEPLLREPENLHAKTLQAMLALIEARNQQSALAPHASQSVLPCPPGMFAMYRASKDQTLLIVCSFVNEAQEVPLQVLELQPGTYADHLGREDLELDETLQLEPYQVRWLQIS